MSVLRSVVVPLDGSPFAEQCLPYAEVIAGRAHARLDLVRVHEAMDVPLPQLAPGGQQGVALLDARGREREHGYLTAVAAHADPSLVVQTHLIDGDVVEALHAYLVESAADLAVLSTHGRGGLARAWLGSVAEGLVRRARIPLLVVPPLRHGPAPPRPALRRILVSLDGSRLAEQVLHAVRDLAAVLRLEIRLLLVIPPLPMPRAKEATHLGSPLTPLAELRPRAQAYLEALAVPLRADGLDVETEVHADTHIARRILTCTDEDGADIIAMATHALHGAARLFLGSVADKVVRAAARPVLLVRPRLPRWNANLDPGRSA